MSPDNHIIWRWVPGYEGRLWVSNTGLVRSVHPKNGRIRLRKLQVSNKGYPVVSASCAGGNKVLLVHRLVALAFVPNPGNKPQVNHKDSNRMNCNALNLEWSTQSENIIHGYKMGGIARGKYKATAVLSEAQVRRVKSGIQAGRSNQELAAMYGVSRTAIYHIRTGRNWRHLT